MRASDHIKNIGRPIAYYPKLAEFFGSVNAALLFCQLLYWDGKQFDREGWIFKTRYELKNETGLNRSGQETARKKLLGLGFLSEKKKGVPRKLYYRINKDSFDEAWSKWIAKNEDGAQPARRTGSNHQDGKNVANKQAGFTPTITESTSENTSKTTLKNVPAASLAGMVDILMERFEKVNPSYELLIKNGTERAALKRLIEKYGFEKVIEIIEILPLVNPEPYAPTITTPYALETKLGRLMAYMSKKQNRREGKEIIGL